jgi:hypothetical protein
MVMLRRVRSAPLLTSITRTLPPPLTVMLPPPSMVNAPCPETMAGRGELSVIVPLTLKVMVSSPLLPAPQSALAGASFAARIASRRVQKASLLVLSPSELTTYPAA